MAVYTITVPRDEWPSIEDGRETDRGWEHFLVLRHLYQGVIIGDDAKIRLVVPPRESWIVEYVEWSWVASPAWTSAQLMRELRHGQVRRFEPTAGEWSPIPAVGFIDRVIYSIPAADEEAGSVARAGILTDICGLRPGAKWGGDWFGATAAGDFEFTLSLQLVRVPEARPRGWTEKDMANALTRIEQLGRRVN
jgi:hypothetical protein